MSSVLINPYRFVAPFSYPYTVALTNPGAETGDMTGWSLIASANGIVVNAPTRSHSGTFFFAAANIGRGHWGQTITESNSALLADIDGGKCELALSVWRNGFTDADIGKFQVDFFDGSDVFLGGKGSQWTDPNAGVDASNANWVQETINCWIPPGTRKFRYSAKGVRVGGTECSAYFDDFEATITKKGANIEHRLLAGLLGDSTTGWTNVTGTLGTKANANARHWSENVLYFTDGAAGTYEAYYQVNTPAAWDTEIDNGDTTVEYDFVHLSLTAGSNATGRLYIEFRTSGDALIGTRTYSDGAAVAEVTEGKSKNFTLAVPATTRKIRFGLVGTYASGADTEAYVNRIMGQIEKDTN